MNKYRLLLPVFVVMCMQTASAAVLTNRYVVKNNPGAAVPYDSLANAAADIQTAIDYAYTVAGSTVLVAAATYDSGGTNAGWNVTNRVYISKAITVRSLNNDPSNTIIKGAWDPVSTNGSTAVRCVFMSANSSLVGFMLTNGATAASGDYRSMCGGGVYAKDALVSNCVISGNAAYGDSSAGVGGGGAYCGTFFNCTFTDNRIGPGRSIGGATHDSILSNCVIAGNFATGPQGCGGGAHKGTLYGCLVSNNTAYRFGGGVAGWNPANPCKAYDCTIVANKTQSEAGGGAGSYSSTEISAILSNCTVAFNTAAGLGGGADHASLFNCRVFSNSAATSGGGTSRSMLTNCTLAYNVADAGGGAYEGALYDCLVYGNYARDAGGVYVSSLYNCTVVGNSAWHVGGGIANYGGNMNVINSIVYSNQCATWPNWTEGYPSCFSFTNSCAFPTSVVWSAGNTTNYPLFMANGSGYGTNHVPGNYRLQPNSPCMNSGLNQAWMNTAVDFDGHSRIDRFSGRVDMGCYEYLPRGMMFKVR